MTAETATAVGQPTATQPRGAIDVEALRREVDAGRIDTVLLCLPPRQILRRQLDRLAERDLAAYAGSELEFIVFRDTYEQAWRTGYRDLEPANYYNVDYSMLGTARGGAAAAADPQLDGEHGHARRVGQR